MDSYAKLAPWTGDSHHLAVATLPLHDTKNMTAAPGRTYDLKGPGWQHEHWSTGALLQSGDSDRTEDGCPG